LSKNVQVLYLDDFVSKLLRWHIQVPYLVKESPSTVLELGHKLVYNTQHAPRRLFVGVAPRKHVREGSNMRSETKIFNLDSDEFGSNPPLKKRPAISISYLTSGGNNQSF
jgi:hypothetical protein